VWLGAWGTGLHNVFAPARGRFAIRWRQHQYFAKCDHLRTRLLRRQYHDTECETHDRWCAHAGSIVERLAKGNGHIPGRGPPMVWSLARITRKRSSAFGRERSLLCQEASLSDDLSVSDGCPGAFGSGNGGNVRSAVRTRAGAGSVTFRYSLNSARQSCVARKFMKRL